MPWRWSIGPVFPANKKKIAQKPLKPVAGSFGKTTPAAKLVAYKVVAKAPVQKPRLITVPSPVITASSPGATLPASQLGETKPGDSQARLALARDLQRELKRVGCYGGNIDGLWGRGSKDAMGAFTRRVNADLPFDEPDYILLTLVQGHFTKACGRSCGSGEVLSDDGRCLAGSLHAATVAAGPDNSAAAKPSGRTKATETVNATETTTAPARLVRLPERARPSPSRPAVSAPQPLERRVQAMSDILASRVTQNSARLDGGAKVGKRPSDVTDFAPLAVTAATQIRTPSISPTNNDAAKRAQAALRRAADREAAKARAKEFVQERRRLAALGRAEDERLQSAAIARSKEARAEEQRQTAADERASRRRAARAQARKDRARRKRRRRLARASGGGRRSYLGAKQRRRARSRPRRRSRRRRSNWKREFWASQGM